MNFTPEDIKRLKGGNGYTPQKLGADARRPFNLGLHSQKEDNSPFKYTTPLKQGEYWYKINGEPCTKAQYLAYENKPGGDEAGKSTNDPDASGNKANTKNNRANNKASKRPTVLTKKQTELKPKKTIPLKQTTTGTHAGDFLLGSAKKKVVKKAISTAGKKGLQTALGTSVKGVLGNPLLYPLTATAEGIKFMGTKKGEEVVNKQKKSDDIVIKRGGKSSSRIWGPGFKG